MSKSYTITDEQLRAAWEAEPTGGMAFMSPDALEAAGWWAELRHAIESTEPPKGFTDGLFYGFVASVRDRLGGWDAVWRAVNTDCGFEPVRGRTAWELALPRAELLADIGPDGWELWIARWKDCIPLRSPADLRVRVGHAKELFTEGTR